VCCGGVAYCLCSLQDISGTTTVAAQGMQSGVLAIPKPRPTDVYEAACVHFAVRADVEEVEVVEVRGHRGIGTRVGHKRRRPLAAIERACARPCNTASQPARLVAGIHGPSCWELENRRHRPPSRARAISWRVRAVGAGAQVRECAACAHCSQSRLQSLSMRLSICLFHALSPKRAQKKPEIFFPLQKLVLQRVLS
jgi:hypothetical protein